MKSKIVSNSWLEEYGEFIAQESYKLIKQVGQNGHKKLSTRFLKFYVNLILKNALLEHTKMPLSQDEAYRLTIHNFQQIKEQIQTEISLAFEKALSDFSGRNMEYYCQIKPVPEVTHRGIN